jgi:thiamine-phosphate pyrophosphorylase
MLRYAITDRTAYAGDLPAQKDALESQARRLAAEGVQYLQLREKDLSVQERVGLAIRLRSAIAGNGPTKLIFNGQPSLALLAVADGVHLPSHMLRHSWRPSEFMSSGRKLLISASCHNLADVDLARTFADVLLYAPVFNKHVRGKQLQAGVGLENLQEACHVAGSVPVLAMGGVNAENVAECLAVGAAGMAGIRVFV